MKRLLLALLFPVCALAQTPVQSTYPQQLGYFVAQATGTLEYSVNAAANRACYAFVLSADKTLSEFRTHLSAVTGSPTAANTVVELIADASGVPSGSAIESKACAATPITGQNDWTGFGTALTGGARYWLCIKNNMASPSVDYVRVRVNGSTSAGQTTDVSVNGNDSKWGWAFCHSTDSGATCATGRAALPHFQLKFSDGTYAGTGINSNSPGAETTDKVYSARELGVKFTVPSDGPSIKVRCASFYLYQSGTPPAGGARYRIYTGASSTPTLLATSYTIPAANTVANNWYPQCFNSTYTLAPGTVIRVVIGVVSGGDASNYYSTGSLFVVDNTAAAKALQYNGALMATYTTDGTTFTDTDTKVYPFRLLLDTNDPFDLTSSGGSNKSSGINGGLN